MLRALVNLSRDLADDIAEACGTLKTKGGATKHERPDDQDREGRLLTAGSSRIAPIRKQAAPTEVLKFDAPRASTSPVEGTT